MRLHASLIYFGNFKLKIITYLEIVSQHILIIIIITGNELHVNLLIIFISAFFIETCCREKRTTSGYFNVDPVLKVNKEETIPLECVSLQTVLSKCLGPLTEWYDRLKVSTAALTKEN